jgi:hypothetical protein
MGMTTPMEQIAPGIVRCLERVPADVPVGLHLCYGHYGHQHFEQPDSRGEVRGAQARPLQGASRWFRGGTSPCFKRVVDDWLTQPWQNAPKSDNPHEAPTARHCLICRQKAHEPGSPRLLAMQKVEGSSPFSRLKMPANRRFSDFLARRLRY